MPGVPVAANSKLHWGVVSHSLHRVRYRILQTLAFLVFLTCLVCPTVEMFDSWDHTPQTGNDTESVFVILALCVGATCGAQHVVDGDALLKITAMRIASSLFRGFSLTGLFASSWLSPGLLQIPISPPAVSLRI